MLCGGICGRAQTIRAAARARAAPHGKVFFSTASGAFPRDTGRMAAGAAAAGELWGCLIRPRAGSRAPRDACLLEGFDSLREMRFFGEPVRAGEFVLDFAGFARGIVFGRKRDLLDNRCT